MNELRLNAIRLAITAVALAFATQANAAVYTWGTSTPGPYSTNYSATGDPSTLTGGDTLNIFNTGDGYLNVGLVNNGGAINDEGIFSFQSPSDSLTNSAGNLVLAANSGTYGYGCAVSGAGCSMLSNAGNMEIAGGGVTTAYTQFGTTGTMIFDLTSAANYGSIGLGGSNNHLGGQFSVNLLGGFTPTVGETFDVLTAGGYNGSFTNTTFSTDGATFEALYSATGVDLTVTSLSGPAAAPEIDPTTTFTGLTLLLGALAVLRGRKLERASDCGA